MKKSFILIISILLIIAGILPGCAAEGGPTSPVVVLVQDITSQQALSLIQQNQGNPDFTILDVRTPAEFAEGHIAGAFNLGVEGPSFREDIEKLDKSDTYLVYCRTGNRSRNAIRIMREAGFTRIYHLANGIVEWTGAGLPVVR